MQTNSARLVVGLVLFSYGSVDGQSANKYDMPAWFWEPPVSQGTSLAAGYSEAYFTAQTSFDEAFNDAAWRLFFDRESRVIGGQATAKVGDSMFHAGKSYKIEADSTRFDSFVGGLVRLDSIVVGKLVVMLVGTATVDFSRRMMPPPDHANPVDFAEKGFIIAMGGSPKYHKEVSSWLEAERNARIEAALSLNAQVKSYEGNIPGLGVKTIVIATDVLMKNVKIVGRSLDGKTGEHMVFVRVRNPL